MAKRPYVPDRGEAIWLDFNPRVGKEQSERRPALVLSKKSFNKGLGQMALVCPITTREPRNELELKIPENCQITGTVLVHQAKVVDLVARKSEKAGYIPLDIVNKASKGLSILAGYQGE